MKRRFAIALAMLMATTTALAQDEPAAQPAGQQPPAGAEQVSAVVIELAGRAYVAPSGTDILDVPAWKALKVGDKIPAGTQIRTPLRTRLLLQIGDDTLVLAKQETLMSLDEMYKTADTKTTRMSLGHGEIRAGVAEGALRSDMTIDSTVATLSKKGTWGFGMSKFGRNVRMSLSERGLVDALFKATGQRRLVFPGQYVDTLTIGRMWILTATFNRVVSMYEFAGLTGAELEDNHLNTSGLAVVQPAPGVGTYDAAGQGGAQRAPTVDMSDQAARAALTLGGQNMFFNRPEGNFGFGEFPGLQQTAKRLRDMFGRHGGGMQMNGPMNGKLGDRRIRPIGGR